MRTIQTCALALLALMALRPAASQGSKQTPVFTSRVELVEVDAVVVDRDGALLRDLRPEEFTLLEDGKVVEISEVEFVGPGRTQPVAPFETPSALSQDRGTTSSWKGRRVLIVYDDRFAGRPADAGTFQRVRTIAGAVVDGLTSQDEAAVVGVSGRRALQIPFTTDKTRLTRPFETPMLGESNTGDDLLDVLLALSLQMEAVKGSRKIIIVIPSEPLGFADAMRVGADGTDVTTRLRRLQTATARDQIVVYVIDPRHSGALTSMIGQSSPASWESERARAASASADFRTLAESTGGRAYTNTNMLREAVRSIFAETEGYYVLRYYSEFSETPSYRHLELKVSRRGAKVRSRQGYWSGPKGDGALQ